MVVIPLNVVLTKFVPGSYPQPWSWDDEERNILEARCRDHNVGDDAMAPHWGDGHCAEPGWYQLSLEEHIRVHGITQGVLLGNDGRLWDGHHRVVAARRLHIDQIPIEDYSWPLS